MFDTHVSKLSSAYLHNELAPAESQRFEQHLSSCGTCRLEFEEIKRGASLAEHLPVVSAPEFIWPRITATLDQPIAPPRFRFLKPLAIVASIVLLAAAGLVFLRQPHQSPQPPTGEKQSGWQVARLGGAPRIGSERISDKGQLGVGQWLETDSVSRAKLDIADVGNVDIDPNTRVRLLQSAANEHRLELERGRLSARISAPPKIFFVNTPSGVAEDLGCAYTLEVDDRGNSHLRVTLGWVALQLRDRESVVPAGAECVTRPGIGPGTPYFEDASDSFRSSLAQFDFAADTSSRPSALEIVRREARPRDAMTLFYLLSRVDGNERARVYDRLTMLLAPPPGVTRQGSLELNPQMMERWKEALGLTWDEPVDQAQKVSTKASTKAVGKFNGLQGKR